MFLIFINFRIYNFLFSIQCFLVKNLFPIVYYFSTNKEHAGLLYEFHESLPFSFSFSFNSSHIIFM